MKRNLLSVFAMAAMLLMGTNSWAQKTYEIGTAEQLNAFAEAVTNGETDANAVLTADIDYTAYPEGIIGLSGDDYMGTFDGQGHKVTLAIAREADGASLFWAIGKTGVVKNLITDGTITTSRKYATGIATYHSGTIENCATYVNITSTIEGDGTHAGIAGVSYNGSIVQNCLSAIKLVGEKTTNCGGITGWLDGKSTIQRCISIAEITIETNNGSDAIARNNGNMAGGNSYFLNQYGSYNATYCAQVNAAMLKSGALCYMINRDQSNISWYQTLDQDEYPVPFATSKQVYAKCDEISCIGKCTGEASYSNEPTGNTPAPHEYEKGICKNCGQEDADYCPLVDGYYQISNAEQLQWFGKKIANGAANINAKLTADIDYTEYGKIVENGDFKGILDGQFHTLTIDIAPSANPAPFNTLYGTVKNLKVAGTIDAGENKFAAAIAAHTYSGSQVLNCTSSVTILSSVTGDGTHAGFVAVNESGLTINFCVFNGKMLGENTTNCGGIVGWSASGTKMTGCVIMPAEASAGIIEYAGSRNPGNLEAAGCYYVNTEAAPVGGINNGFIEYTEEAAKSGEMCYKMNGDQSSIGWTQNLGTDDAPNNEGLGKQVYTDAPMNCDGKLKADATGSYSNDPSVQGAIPDHEYENGVCVNCGAKEAGFMEPDADGYYNIGDAKQLVWFASNINSGDNKANGRLTADIDMEGLCDKFKPIGTEASPFSAKFDGQSHRISNLVVEQEENCAGLFGYVQAPCSVENLILDETCSLSGKGYCGLIGESVGVSGEVIMTNLGNEGTVTATGANAGGIIGCCMSSSATFIITNCYVTGTVTGGNESGAISGWVGDKCTMTGVWTTAEVTGVESDSKYVVRYGTAPTAKNCFSKNGSQYTNITDFQVENGELTYMLNGKSFKNPSWFQTIGDDPKPVLDSTHGVVYEANGEFADVHDEATFKTFVEKYTGSEKQFCETVVAQQSLVDEYAANLENLSDLTSMNAFAEAFEEIAALKNAINTCADAYAKYQAKVEETLVYLNEGAGAELEGTGRDFLQDYLEGADEPGEYPNGAYEYIMENRLLSQEEILAEIEYITQMIDAAVRGGIMPGTDVTSLLKNPTFIDGFDGWEGKKATGTGASDNGMRAGEVWATTMDMYQTLTDLQNGVYELKINGAYRPNQNKEPLESGHGTNYAGLFYLNGVQNYFMADIEDMLPIEDAQDKVNCLTSEGTTDLEIEDEEGNVIGLIAHGPAGLSYAIEADRYNNSLLVNVTDGTMTVGIKKLDTYTNSQDWLGFGNIKLTYMGELAEAGESLDGVLADMSARANTILTNYIFDDGENYKVYPNFSQAIKDELQATIDAVDAAADAEAKYALVQKFSDLFQQVYDCKKAYIDMVALASSLEDAALTLSDAGKISDAEAEALMTANADCWEAFSDGSYTYEQATNIEVLKNNTIAPAEVDGKLQIANEKNMVWLSGYVNAGNTAVTAVLTNDINMEGIDFAPIGNSSNIFTGTFDGQGHKISHLTISRPDTEGVGLIGFIATPATITDFVLDETCSISGKAFVGIIGESAAVTGPVYINKLGNEGTVEASAQNAGGIIGCCMSSSATFYIDNCYVTGPVSGANESAAISGWTGSNSNVTNCWSTSEVKGTDSASKYFYRYGTIIVDNNNWCKNGSQVSTLSDESVANGMLCFTLNGSSSENPVWFQQLGVDAHPVFRGAIVYNNLGEFTNTDPNAIDAIAMDGELKANDGNVYDLTGRLIRKANNAKDLKGLKGLYIIGNKKYILK